MARANKEEWDMNIDLNRVKHQVAQRPSLFYNDFDGIKEKLLTANASFEQKPEKTQRLEALNFRELDQDLLQMEEELQRPQPRL